MNDSLSKKIKLKEVIPTIKPGEPLLKLFQVERQEQVKGNKATNQLIKTL